MPEPTVNAFEAKPETGRMIAANARLLIGAFEAAGLEFIPENGGGAGIRFRERTEPVFSAVRAPKPPYDNEAEHAAAERAERKAKGQGLPGDAAAEAEWQADLARMRKLTGKA